jgi:hypothetical protein
MDELKTPPGWYEYDAGRRRYWNGVRWEGPPLDTEQVPTPRSPRKRADPMGAVRLTWTLAGLALLVLIAAVGFTGSDAVGAGHAFTVVLIVWVLGGFLLWAIDAATQH